MENQKLISVIVPIYKVEQYLRDCVDSILASTYQNLEVLLVDDGSPDNCGSICDDYAGKDSRIRVIHQKNQGLVGARNTGLAAARGEYIAFVDSDDMVSPVQFETLAAVMEQTGADLVGCEGCKVLSQLCRTRPQIDSVYTAKSYEEKLALLVTSPAVRKISWTSCYVWNKLYKKDCIREIFDKKCLICEDINFNWKYIQSCGCFVTIPVPLYYYRQNEQSVTARYHRLEAKPALSVANACAWEDLTRIPVSDPVLDAFLKARVAYTAHSALLRIYCTSYQDDREEINHLKGLVRSNFSWLWKDHGSYGLPIRMGVALYRYAFPLWFLLVKLYQSTAKIRLHS